MSIKLIDPALTSRPTKTAMSNSAGDAEPLTG